MNKKFVVAILLGLAAIVLIYTRFYQNKPVGPLLYIGVTPAGAPFSFIDENNQLTGFDIDIAKYLAKTIDYIPEFIVKSPKKLIKDIKKGKIHLILDMQKSVIEPQYEHLTYSNPYLLYKDILVITHKDIFIKNKEELTQYKINQLNSSSVKKLLDGKIDGVTVPNKSLNILLSYPDINKANFNFSVLEGPNIDSCFGISTQYGEKFINKINQAIDEISANDVIGSLKEKWNI